MSRTAQLAQSAPAVSFAALEQAKPVDIVHFAAINNSDGFYLTSREASKEFQWSDLHGQEVLVDHLFQPHATLRYAMYLNNADFDNMNIIDAGNVQQMDQAFRQGQGNYVHQQGPAPQQLEKGGLDQTSPPSVKPSARWYSAASVPPPTGWKPTWLRPLYTPINRPCRTS